MEFYDLMSDTSSKNDTAPSNEKIGVEKKHLTEEAKRAIAEAEERRKNAASNAEVKPREIKGRKGPEPVRYGDWEKDGIISDF